MSSVSVFTEWDPLEEVVVGRVDNIRLPTPDPGLWAVEYQDLCTMDEIRSGPYSQKIVEETDEDLAELVRTFEDLGVVVRRPNVFDHSSTFATIDWRSDGQQSYCPRDVFLAIDDWIIEAPMILRSRYFESLAYRDIMLSYLGDGARWVAAPKPRLLDEMYVLDENPDGLGSASAIREHEPVFDAANILRVGRDVLYLVSSGGNRLGAQWLQNLLGSEFKVHTYDSIYTGTHVDTTITLVRPGLVVVNAERIGPHNLPHLFKDWDVIYLDEVVDIGGVAPCSTSKWIGINFMMVNEGLAIGDAAQTPLIRELGRFNVEVIPLSLRHARTLAGGFHCVTLDVRRRGELQSYC